MIDSFVMNLTMLKAIWAYRGFILGSVKREFQVKYRNSLLGAAWTVINPLAMITVYTVIFSQVMKARLPGVDSTYAYGIYLCAGLLPWGFFAEMVSRLTNIFLEHPNLMKKVSFPRMCLPIIVVLGAGVNFAITMGIFLCFLILFGSFPGWHILSVLPVLFVQIVFSIGLGMILGVMNVFFRDVGQLFNVVLQFWFWFTPIVYPSSILPENITCLLNLNLMAPMIKAYQDIFVLNIFPDFKSLIIPFIFSLFFCLLGLRQFRKHVGEMVDEL